jgi:hypothetical protein
MKMGPDITLPEPQQLNKYNVMLKNWKLCFNSWHENWIIFLISMPIRTLQPAHPPSQVACVRSCTFQRKWTLLPTNKCNTSEVYEKKFVLYGLAGSWKKYSSGDILLSESKTHDVLGDQG